MRITVFCSILLLGCALSKTVTKALTESLGQEVIEIGAPLKELPPELEEEPSLEKDDDETTRASVAPATKRDVKKPAVPVPVVDGRRKLKDIDRIDGVEQEDDEQRVEKEISEIYKDNDYKADSNERNELRASGEKDSALRQRNQKTEYKFQPNLNNPKDVELFRTSQDDLACDRQYKLSDQSKSTLQPDKAASACVSMALLVTCACAIGVYYC